MERLFPPAQNQVVSLCGVCSAGCGAEVHLEEGRITRLTPIQNHPYSVLCTRGLKAPEIVRGAVEVNMGGGGPLGPLAWQQANANALTNFEHRDPISGFPVFKALLCEVKPRTAQVEPC